MKVEEYLSHIGYSGGREPTNEALFEIHERHLLRIPFENLDIHFKRPLSLDPDDLFDKVVNRNRGGFCYELNYLFNLLLEDIGFNSRIVSSRVFMQGGKPGPEFDHMSVLVYTDRTWLCDVGFGDLFLTPLEVEPDKSQSDGRNRFKIVPHGVNGYAVMMSAESGHLENKYTFTPFPRVIDDFVAPCVDKQVNPESHFVKNTICTRATPEGRITIYNDKFIERNSAERFESSISGDVDLKKAIKVRFGMEI